MSPRAFDRALDFVLRAEGGATITNDPRDPGGLTRFGISKRAHPDVDVLNLTREDAAAIYRRDYWDAAHCDELPEAIAFVLMDCAVNQGVTTAIRLLQKAVGVLPDGVFGPKTREAAAQVDLQATLVRFCEKRWDHYFKLPTFDTFGRGWTFRLFRVQSEALFLAAALEAR